MVYLTGTETGSSVPLSGACSLPFFASMMDELNRDHTEDDDDFDDFDDFDEDDPEDENWDDEY